MTQYIYFKTAISILLISSHDSFRVLFDKIASVYILFEKYIHILALEMTSHGTGTAPIGSAHFRSLSIYFVNKLLKYW